MKITFESTRTGDIKITTPRWTNTIPVIGTGKRATGGFEFTWKRLK